MAIKRLNSLSHSEMAKIRRRQKVGTMSSYTDKDGYLCYDTNEIETYKPRKNGRPPKKV